MYCSNSWIFFLNFEIVSKQFDPNYFHKDKYVMGEVLKMEGTMTQSCKGNCFKKSV